MPNSAVRRAAAAHPEFCVSSREELPARPRKRCPHGRTVVEPQFCFSLKRRNPSLAEQALNPQFCFSSREEFPPRRTSAVPTPATSSTPVLLLFQEKKSL